MTSPGGGLRIRFSFYGDVQLDRTLARFQARAINATPAFEQIRESFLRAERRQFDSEGHYASGGWQALSPAYAAWKARHYPGRKILVRTGELERSLTEGPQINVIEPHMAIFGSAVEYGAYHQNGGENLPRRRPVELPASLRVRWVKIIQAYLVGSDYERYAPAALL